MKTNKELYNERLTRIKKAIALEKPDKTPFAPMMDSFCARHMGYTLAQFCFDVELSNKIMIDSIKDLGEVDAASGTSSFAGGMGLIFMCRVKLPGRELPENALWQLDEQELMKPEDYDTIISKGWQAFSNEYVATRMNVDFELLGKTGAFAPIADQRMREAGYPVYGGGVVSLPVDYLSGGRTMAKFMMDIKRMPEKVTEVMDIIMKNNIETMKAGLKAAVDPIDVFIAMARGCPDFYSTKIWEKFVWRYLKEVTETCIEEGIAADFHIDANWERGLDYFKDFPKGTCVFETDGMTDIYKVKEKLGDIMCIKGDVQAGKLTLGTPEEVYNYSTRLIRDMGPGFILAGGCSIPPNAKVENVRAMVAAAAGK
ncbi:MAG: uroporphyrinogen decarboxylase family protein [Clostridiales bacterium]|jgi:uroporphyrinogen decarboxylase|nr:uroporphyrinogen-III decarboxylase [Eubacteriales bacterium]MDH7565994.1 uroporphyrinogen decarboxylase family protein [Clostridiales bacterium]